MQNRIWRAGLLALCAMVFCIIPARPAAPAQPMTHVLTLSSVDQTTDTAGRKVLVGHITGDLPGILTMVLAVGPGGAITGGEWALNVSYQVFGAPSPDGDGDPSEQLVQLGHFKGTVLSGSAAILPNGVASSANSVQLKVTGATVKFAGVKSGSGTFAGSGLDVNSISSGTFTLTY